MTTIFGNNPVLKVHPAIGIARVGNSLDSFFLGPEIPGQGPVGKDVDSPFGATSVPSYKKNGKVKRQAARFRVFHYVLNSTTGLLDSKEVIVGRDNVKAIKWTVHLANRKAAFYKFDGLAGEGSNPSANLRNINITNSRNKLHIDPGERTISGLGTGPIPFDYSNSPPNASWPRMKSGPNTGDPVIDYLGELWTDKKGRLIVLGGRGNSRPDVPGKPIISYANNPGWYDDISDGPVFAEIDVLVDGEIRKFTAKAGWILVTPPNFTPRVNSTVTLYDTLYDVAHTKNLRINRRESIYHREPLKWLSDMRVNGIAAYKPSFSEEVFPFLERIYMHGWVNHPANLHHTSLVSWAQLSDPNSPNLLREFIFKELRNPNNPNIKGMPKVLGDEPYEPAHERYRLSLPNVLWEICRNWSQGKFIGGKPSRPAWPKTRRPELLDKAALEDCVGGAFFPGIECGWLIRQPKVFKGSQPKYSEPFRIEPFKRTASGSFDRFTSGPRIGVPKPNKIQYGGQQIPIRAGFFSQQMAVPWQADFRDCKAETHSGALWGWWPAQRPDHAPVSTGTTPQNSQFKDWARATNVNGNSIAWPNGTTPQLLSWLEMVDNWYKFGFVLETTPGSGRFKERERKKKIP